jgi:hypothetical protein
MLWSASLTVKGYLSRSEFIRSSDKPDFDHYLDLNDIPLEQAAEAFATYLALEPCLDRPVPSSRSSRVG